MFSVVVVAETSARSPQGIVSCDINKNIYRIELSYNCLVSFRKPIPRRCSCSCYKGLVLALVHSLQDLSRQLIVAFMSWKVAAMVNLVKYDVPALASSQAYASADAHEQ